jgi:hypothetical protein
MAVNRAHHDADCPLSDRLSSRIQSRADQNPSSPYTLESIRDITTESGTYMARCARIPNGVRRRAADPSLWMYSRGSGTRSHAQSTGGKMKGGHVSGTRNLRRDYRLNTDTGEMGPLFPDHESGVHFITEQNIIETPLASRLESYWQQVCDDDEDTTIPQANGAEPSLPWPSHLRPPSPVYSNGMTHWPTRPVRKQGLIIADAMRPKDQRVGSLRPRMWIDPLALPPASASVASPSSKQDSTPPTPQFERAREEDSSDESGQVSLNDEGTKH